MEFEVENQGLIARTVKVSELEFRGSGQSDSGFPLLTCSTKMNVSACGALALVWIELLSDELFCTWGPLGRRGLVLRVLLDEG